MPTPTTLAAFIACVESNAHVEAIRDFYTEGATMQENNSPPQFVPRFAKVTTRGSAIESVCS